MYVKRILLSSVLLVLGMTGYVYGMEERASADKEAFGASDSVRTQKIAAAKTSLLEMKNVYVKFAVMYGLAHQKLSQIPSLSQQTHGTQRLIVSFCQQTEVLCRTVVRGCDSMIAILGVLEGGADSVCMAASVDLRDACRNLRERYENFARESLSLLKAEADAGDHNALRLYCAAKDADVMIAVQISLLGAFGFCLGSKKALAWATLVNEARANEERVIRDLRDLSNSV